MAIDTSMYANALSPVKSVQEYDNDRMQGQQNALTLTLGRQKADEYTRGIADQSNLRQVVGQFGDDKTANYNALLRAGRMTEAGAYQKANVEFADKTAETSKRVADTNKTDLESVGIASQQHKDALGPISDPDQAAQWVRAAYSDPRLAAISQHGGTLEEAIARIPRDPAGFAQWKMQSSLGADKLIAYTRADANTVANNATSIAVGAANNATTQRGQNMTAGTAAAGLAQSEAHFQAGEAGKANAVFPPEDVTTMAQQYLAGDKSVMSNIGRGTQGAQNIVLLRAEIGKQLRASGASGADQAAKIAEYGGLVTGLRATGNISARVDNAATEAANLAPLAIEAGRNVTRSGFLPFGKAGIMFDTQTNNPELARFATANTGLATAYASAMARGNKPTVSDNEHARALLSTAMSQQAYEATVSQMKAEIEQAQKAPRDVRKGLADEIRGRAAPAPAAAPGGMPTDIAALLAKHGGK